MQDTQTYYMLLYAGHAKQAVLALGSTLQLCAGHAARKDCVVAQQCSLAVIGMSALCLLQEPSLAQKAVEAAEALKAKTEEAAERARESLKSAAGTAGMAGQYATGTSKSTIAAQQAKQKAAEGAHTVEHTVAQDAERVTSLYGDQYEGPRDPQLGARQPSTQVCAPAAFPHAVLRHDTAGDPLQSSLSLAMLVNSRYHILRQSRALCRGLWVSGFRP